MCSFTTSDSDRLRRTLWERRARQRIMMALMRYVMAGHSKRELWLLARSCAFYLLVRWTDTNNIATLRIPTFLLRYPSQLEAPGSPLALATAPSDFWTGFAATYR